MRSRKNGRGTRDEERWARVDCRPSCLVPHRFVRPLLISLLLASSVTTGAVVGWLAGKFAANRVQQEMRDKLGEVAPDDVAIGMAVEAVWRPLDERIGSILDIAYFRPRTDG